MTTISGGPCEPRTWRRKSGLASWTFKASPEPVAPLHAGALAALRALGAFATAVRVAISTTSQGDDTAVLQGAEEVQDPANIDAVFARLLDVRQVFFDLDLCVVDENGAGMITQDGASLWMDLNDWSGRPTLVAYFDLEVDLYAPRTWGYERDNGPLAALNAPRLNGFLRRLRDELRATEVTVDAPDYDSATADGFRLDVT